MGCKIRILVNTTNSLSTNQFFKLNAYVPMQIKCDICNTQIQYSFIIKLTKHGLAHSLAEFLYVLFRTI